MHPRVVNVRAPGATWNVYVGRGKCPRTGKRGAFGNPFPVADHGPEAMRLYLDWVAKLWAGSRAGSLGFRQAVELLAGETLGCWCAPRPCHAEVLARLADGEDLPAIRASMLKACGLGEA